MIFLVDDEHTVKYMNKAASEIAIAKENEIIGKSAGSVFPGKLYSLFSRGIMEALRTERQLTIEEGVVLPDTERWLNTLFMPIVIPNNPTVQVLVIARDVSAKRSGDIKIRKACENMQNLLDEKILELQRTSDALQRAVAERIRVEEELHKTSERYKALVSSIPGAVFSCAPDQFWTMEFLSDQIEEIAGYQSHEFLYNNVRSYASIIVPEDAIVVADVIGEALNTKAPYEIRYRIHHADGSVRTVYEKGRGIFANDGSPIRIEGIIFNITLWGTD